MLKDLVGTYQVIKGTEYLFTPPREVVGKCPRCGGEVAELQKGFFCQNKDCKFAIWKNNKWWAAKKKQPTKAVVSALLKDGRVHVTGLYSEKTGKTYDCLLYTSYLSGCMFNDPVGMAIYAELHYMMSSLMLGECRNQCIMCTIGNSGLRRVINIIQ